MNSSTSSSEAAAEATIPVSHGRLALLGILLVVLVLELGLRYVERHHSQDMAQLRNLQEIARQTGLREAPTLLLMGNSLTRAGVDQPLLEASLRQQGKPDITVGLAHRNDTTIAEWPAMYRWLSAQMQHKPNWVVLGFARNQLLHQRPVNPTVLAVDYGSIGGLSRHLGDDLQNLDAVIEFVLADQLRLVAHRYRISRVLLRLLLPGYAEQAARLNEPGPAAANGAGLPAEATARGWARLRALAAQVRADGAQLVLVAMPVQGPYRLPPRLRADLAALGVILLDARRLPLDAADFVDTHHLSATGRQAYSRWLGVQLASRVIPAREAETTP